MKKFGVFATLALALGTSAMAAPVTPFFDTFGTLAGATFGGSGIPNNAVAISNLTYLTSNFETIEVTLGLTAFQRYQNTAITNDGNGTFTANAGANTGNPADPSNPAHPMGATWSFGFYINITGGTFRDFDFDLFYDLDGGKNTDMSQLGRIRLDSFVPAATTLAQDSQNLMFGFLSGVPPVAGVNPPSASFNPFAGGEYSFVLRASERDNGPAIGESSILVNVNAVPEPVSLALVGVGLLAAGAATRRRRG